MAEASAHINVVDQFKRVHHTEKSGAGFSFNLEGDNDGLGIELRLVIPSKRAFARIVRKRG